MSNYASGPSFKQLSPTMRINRAPGTGRSVLEKLNTVYGYYATVRFLPDDDFKHYMSSTWDAYDGPVHEAELKYSACRHICG